MWFFSTESEGLSVKTKVGTTRLYDTISVSPLSKTFEEVEDVSKMESRLYVQIKH